MSARASRARSRRGALLWAAAALSTSACAGSARDHRENAAPSQVTASREPTGAADTLPCGAGLRLSTYLLVPEDARLAASIDLDHAELDAALGHLSALDRDRTHHVPIVAAVTLANLETQVRVIEHVLDRAGFAPVETVLVVAEDGAQGWIWRSECDLAIARERVERAWGLRVRDTTSGPVGSPPSQSRESFAFEVLFLSADLMALVPVGQATRFHLWLAKGRSRASALAPAPDPGARLDALAPAPIRVVLSARGLLGSAAGTKGETARHIRATAQGLQIDGKAQTPRP